MSCSPFTKLKKQSFSPPRDNAFELVRPPTPIRIEGYDGPIVSGMTLCVESFIGTEGGKEGGAERLTNYPMEGAWL